jgi:hypothetical protein
LLHSTPHAFSPWYGFLLLYGYSRAINCYLACGFRQEGVRREAELYPDGWKDFIMMGILRSEYAAQAGIPGRAGSAHSPTA